METVLRLKRLPGFPIRERRRQLIRNPWVIGTLALVILLAVLDGIFWHARFLAVLFFIALIFGALIIYFLPTLIAWSRNHRNGTGVFLLNLLLGWTLLGWVGGLVWAVVEQERGHK